MENSVIPDLLHYGPPMAITTLRLTHSHNYSSMALLARAVYLVAACGEAPQECSEFRRVEAIRPRGAACSACSLLWHDKSLGCPVDAAGPLREKRLCRVEGPFGGNTARVIPMCVLFQTSNLPRLSTFRAEFQIMKKTTRGHLPRSYYTPEL